MAPPTTGRPKLSNSYLGKEEPDVMPKADWRRPYIINRKSNNTKMISEDDSPRYEHGNAIPIYCALMGLIIIGCFIYVIYKYFKGNHSGLGSGKTSTAEKPLISLVDGQYKFHYNPTRPDPNGYAPPSYNMPTRPKCQNDRLVRELPQTHLEKIEENLSEAKNGVGWEQLANQLGYGQAEITAFESRATEIEQETGTPATPVHQMLRDWCPRDSASVETLAIALEQIGRKDTVALLRPSVSPGGLRSQATSNSNNNSSKVLNSGPESEKASLIGQENQGTSACVAMGRV